MILYISVCFVGPKILMYFIEFVYIMCTKLTMMYSPSFENSTFWGEIIFKFINLKFTKRKQQTRL
jgi:hypothetical protein